MSGERTSKTYSRELYIVVSASLIVAFYTIIIALVLYSTYCKMEKDNKEHYRQQMLTEADSLAYFIRERKEEISQHAQNPFILAYIKNKALGMSYSLGLSQNLLAIKNEFNTIFATKKYIDGSRIYDGLALFDPKGNLEVSLNPKHYNFSCITKSIATTGTLKPVHLGCNREIFYVTAPCKIRGKTVGWLVGILRWDDIFNKFLQVTSKAKWKNPQIDYSKIEVGILDDGTYLVSTGTTNIEPEFFHDLFMRYITSGKSSNTFEFKQEKESLIAYIGPVKFTTFYYVKIYPKCMVTHIYQSKILLNALMAFGFLLSVWLFFSVKKSIESVYLKAEVKRAEELATSKSEFLATMSHEIRTPLNGLIGALHLMKNEEISSAAKFYLDTAIKLGDKLVDIINNILQYSRLEDGGSKAVIKLFDPQQLVEDLVDLNMPLLRDKDIKIYSFVDCPLKVMGDEGKIAQILANLIGNAIKFTEHGWIKVYARCLKSEDKHAIEFIVEDTGCGIPPDMSERIFNAFEQGDHSVSALLEGVGLGLTIVKRLTEILGGHVKLETKEGKGTKFSVTIPITPIEDSEVQLPQPDKEKTKYVILIDDQNLREIVELYLRKWDLPIISAHEISHYKDKYIVVIADGKGVDSTEFKQLAAQAKDRINTILICPVEDKVRFHNRPEILKIITIPLKAKDLLNGLTDTKIEEKEEVPSQKEEAEFDLKCLLVEDNLLNQKITKTMLERMNIQVDVAKNGQEAVEMFQINNYDFILMDCQMPIMDGFEATKQIRQIEQEQKREKSVWIIALTAQVMEATERGCIDVGMNDYLAKPITPQDLESAIKRINSKT